MQLQDVKKLIQTGESETVEFKMSTGQRTTAAKTLCGVLNGTGPSGANYIITICGTTRRSPARGRIETSLDTK